LNRNTTSFEGAYSQLVVDVGSKTRQADINSEAQLGLLNQAIDAREAKSGVNLDEEAADMIRFQQAYQASARVIATADTLFKTLIDAVGG
jgi:flagellar hook-associated protein 1 FlgK